MASIDIQAAVTALLAVCGAIITLGGAIAVLVKLYQWARRPSEDAAAKIAELTQHDERDYRRFDKLEEAIREQGEQNRLILDGLMQVMTHEIDGNHVDQLKATRDRFQTYLIEHQKGTI